MGFSARQAALLNRIQKDIPLVRNPFAVIAEETGYTREEVLESLSGLREAGVIRNISAIFNPRTLGYHTVLVALSVAEEHIRDAAEIINSHPGVSHNYLRDHRYNIWFTLAAESLTIMENTVLLLSRKSKARDCLLFRNEKLFKIGLILNIGGAGTGVSRINPARHAAAGKHVFTDEERESVLLLQNDLPLEERPFRKIAENAGGRIDEDTLISHGNSFKDKMIIRRYAAVLRHHRAGYRANAMTVWKFDNEEQKRTVPEMFARESAISHLYLRTVYPGRWEYPLFAMIHSTSDEGLQETIEHLSHISGIEDYQVLRTIGEFKKKRVTYFSREFHDWESREVQ